MSISWDDLVRDAGDAITSFEALPEGDYDFEVVDSKTKPTKDGKKKMYEIKAKVIGGAHNGRFVWDNIVLTTDNPNALGFFFKKMAGLGLTPDYFRTQKPTDEQIVSTLRNRRFRAKIGHRVWNGDKKAEIKQYYPQAAAAASQLPPSVQQAAAPPPQQPTPAAPPQQFQPTPPPQQFQPAPPPQQFQPQQPQQVAEPAPAPAPAPQQQQDPWTGQQVPVAAETQPQPQQQQQYAPPPQAEPQPQVPQQYTPPPAPPQVAPSQEQPAAPGAPPPPPF